MRVDTRAWATAALLSVLLARKGEPESRPAAPDGPPVLATIDGIPVTLEDLSPLARLQVQDLLQQAYNIQRQAVDELITYRLLTREAARRGLTMDQLLAERVDKLVTPATSEEVEERYQATRATAPPLSERELRSAIGSQIGMERRQELVRRLVDEIKLKVPVEIRLVAPRIAVSAEGPRRGRETAPVTIVMFSDFQCPGCAAVQETLHRLLQDYDERVNLVYRHFPMDKVHPRSRPAAVAAACAEEQGRFWEYHDRLYEQPPRLGADDLVAHASALGLDAQAFRSCMNSERASLRVQKDVEHAALVGVISAPTYYINGRPLMGVPPFASFRAIVEDELARVVTQVNKPPTSLTPPVLPRPER